jgi:hypothetical protein
MIMAKTVQARLPAEMTPIVKEIKVFREKRLEPTSTKSIIIDALKNMLASFSSESIKQG